MTEPTANRPGFDESAIMAELMRRLQPINTTSGKLLGVTYDRPDTDREKAELWYRMGQALDGLTYLARSCFDLALSLDDAIDAPVLDTDHPAALPRHALPRNSAHVLDCDTA